MKKLLKRLFFSAVVILIVLVGLLAYSFTAAKIALGPAQEDIRFLLQNKPDPSKLPEVTLSLLKTGKMLSREVFSYRGGSWGKEYESGMAAVLVRHPQATLLFDSGFGAGVDRHAQTMPFLMRTLSSYVKEQPAAVQLRGHGITADQIKMIILSHSHWDHISGLEDFPGVEVWLPQREIDDVPRLPPSALIQSMIGKLKLHPISFTGSPYENFDQSLDLFQDGSVVLVPLPGHTDGSVGMFVNLRSGKRFFFIGDLTWAIEGIQLPAERPWLARRLVDKDEAQVRRTIVKVHELSRAYPDLVIIPAHDRRLHDRIANFPDFER
jgi:glyoxylase-like metal-dependent hydrolase (beta-lactamase superfamily II)